MSITIHVNASHAAMKPAAMTNPEISLKTPAIDVHQGDPKGSPYAYLPIPNP